MGIRGWGDTLEQAFEETAMAMAELCADRKCLETTATLKVECEGEDLTELLLEFLNSLLAEADRAGLVLGTVSVDKIYEENGRFKLKARAMCAPYESAREALLIEVKAATYYGASVKRSESGGWIAQCVVDL